MSIIEILEIFLSLENVRHTYLEGPGIHDWDFWDNYIEKAIEWLVNKL